MKGLDKIAKTRIVGSPIYRLLTSTSERAARIGEQLFDTGGILTKANEAGIYIRNVESEANNIRKIFDEGVFPDAIQRFVDLRIKLAEMAGKTQREIGLVAEDIQQNVMEFGRNVLKGPNKINKTTPVIILLSATEQHGPHLPLSTDRNIGEHFLQELNRIMEKEIILLPIIPIGCSEHHMDFCGSLTFKHTTFKILIEEIVESMYIHGFKNFLFLNSHGGNQGIGQVILEGLGNKYPKCQFSFITWWKIAGEELKKINTSGPGGTGHAGEFETSLMLHICLLYTSDAADE